MDFHVSGRSARTNRAAGCEGAELNIVVQDIQPKCRLGAQACRPLAPGSNILEWPRDACQRVAEQQPRAIERFVFPGSKQRRGCTVTRTVLYGAGRVYLFEDSKVYSLDIPVLVAHR